MKVKYYEQMRVLFKKISFSWKNIIRKVLLFLGIINSFFKTFINQNIISQISFFFQKLITFLEKQHLKNNIFGKFLNFWELKFKEISNFLELVNFLENVFLGNFQFFSKDIKKL